MIIIKKIILIILGFGTGLVISGAIFAFIAMIGIVPTMARKTRTQNKVIVYEEMIIFGGIFGILPKLIGLKIIFNKLFIILFGFCEGVFVGCLAISLAEVLDVIPILSRRVKIKEGLFILTLSIAIGKMIGSLIYFFIPGFFSD